MDTTLNNKWKAYTRPMMIIAVIFSILGFATGINAFFIPFLRSYFNISTAQSYLVTTATFSAFVLFGLPSSIVLKKLGYKKSMFTAFIIMAGGMLVVIPAAYQASFVLFLIALFLLGIGQTLLNTAVNPYITIIGPAGSAAKRISIMGACNKLSYGLAPVLLAAVMDTSQAGLKQVVTPFYFIAVVLLLLGVFSYLAPLPEVVAEGENENDKSAAAAYASSKKSVFGFPHLVLGAIAIFLYVGVETIALASINEYAIENGLPDPQRFAIYTSWAYVAGYFSGIILIPRFLSQLNALIICSLSGIVFTLLVVFVPGHTGIYFVAAFGLANSLIWPALWPLALADLGKFTKAGSSLLVMGIAGGGLVPPLLGFLKDTFGSYQQAYWMVLPVYVYFLYYALAGHKLR